MLTGVLRMPPSVWNADDAFDVALRHARYLEAADRIQELEIKVAELEAIIASANHCRCVAT